MEWQHHEHRVNFHVNLHILPLHVDFNSNLSNLYNKEFNKENFVKLVLWKKLESGAKPPHLQVFVTYFCNFLLVFITYSKQPWGSPEQVDEFDGSYTSSGLGMVHSCKFILMSFI